jgi:hypothetical protein
MSFVLPGNQRQLRFTGEAKALKDESGTPGAALALGKPRVRKPTTPPPALVPSTRSSRNTGMTPASPGQESMTPGSFHRPAPARIRGPGSFSPSVRSARAVDPSDRSWDGEDHQATMAFDREGADVLPGRASTRPPPAAVSVSPIPHIRPATPAMQAVIVPSTPSGSTEIRSTKGAPLALWIFAAILAGILSYHVTPAVMTHFDPPPPPVKAGG